MAIHLKVGEALEDYLVNRNIDALKNLVKLLETEIADPSMQEAILKVPMTREDIDRAIAENDYLKLPVQSVDANDVPVYEDKLIRVVCSDQTEGKILKVGNLDDKFIKLFPIVGLE